MRTIISPQSLRTLFHISIVGQLPSDTQEGQLPTLQSHHNEVAACRHGSKAKTPATVGEILPITPGLEEK